MAGSAPAGAGGLQVLLVRHGESANNPLYAEILGPVASEPAASEARKLAEEKWLASRWDDPPLTGKGVTEAEDFGAVYAPRLARAVGPGGRVRIFVSPFLRTCQTAAPLVSQLGAARCIVEVRPDIFEVGGVYTEAGGQRGGPGRCLSPEQIEQRFPGYSTSALAGARDAGWYTGGWETDAEARTRAKRVAEWLRSPALHEACEQSGGKTAWAVLVMHGHFIDLLVKALLGLEDDPSRDKAGTNSIGGRAVAIHTPNTAVGHLTILKDGGVQVHYLGRTDHLAAAATPPKARDLWQFSLPLAALAVGVVAGSLLSRRSSL